jgi:hypothetical protein
MVAHNIFLVIIISLSSFNEEILPLRTKYSKAGMKEKGSKGHQTPLEPIAWPSSGKSIS